MSNPKYFKAYQFKTKDGPLEKAEIQWHPPKENEVVVKVLACGVCGSDLFVQKQIVPWGLPRTPGHEIVGDIFAVPHSEKVFKVGDRVGAGWHGAHCCGCGRCRAGDYATCENEEINGVTRDGGYAEFVTLKTEALVPVPKDMDPAEAAPLLCAGVTTYNSLRHMNVMPGDIVAVQGIGGLGHLALQFSNAMGYRTIALSHTMSKEEVSKKLGAVEYIDGGDQAKALKDMGGAKIVMCTAPSSQIIHQMLGALTVDGQLLMLALPHDSADINLASLVAKRQSIRGWPSGTAKDSEDCVNFAKLKGIKSMVEKFPLDKAPEAYEHRLDAKFRAVIVP